MRLGRDKSSRDEKFQFLTDSPAINDRLGTSTTRTIRFKPENVGITKIFDLAGVMISQKYFPQFLSKDLCRKIGVSQSIFDPQTRSKTYFRRSTRILAQFAEK